MRNTSARIGGGWRCDSLAIALHPFRSVVRFTRKLRTCVCGAQGGNEGIDRHDLVAPIRIVSAICTGTRLRIDWYKPDGGLKDMMARVTMLAMHCDGLISLPPPKWRQNRLGPIVFGQATEPPLFPPPGTLWARMTTFLICLEYIYNSISYEFFPRVGCSVRLRAPGPDSSLP